jgi:hypothetical protein
MSDNGLCNAPIRWTSPIAETFAPAGLIAMLEGVITRA